MFKKHHGLRQDSKDQEHCAIERDTQPFDGLDADSASAAGVTLEWLMDRVKADKGIHHDV